MNITGKGFARFLPGGAIRSTIDTGGPELPISAGPTGSKSSIVKQRSINPPAELRFFGANGKRPRFVSLTRDNNDNAIRRLPPSPRARSIFSFSPFPAAHSRQSWLCVTIVRSLDRPIARSQVADNYKRYARTHPVYRVSRQKEAKAHKASRLLSGPPLFPPFFSIMNIRATEKNARHMAAKSCYRCD